MVIFGYILLFVGSIAIIIGEIMLLTAAYKRSLVWFFGCLFFPIFWLLFLFSNLKLTIKPFCVFLLGLVAGWFGYRLTGIEF